jgi:hypothetical protein
VKTKTGIAILFLLIVSSMLCAQEKSKIEWAAVSGAASYEVLVKSKDTDKIQNFTTSSTFIEEQLMFGEYEIKIIAYNDRNELIGESEWSDLTLVRTAQPKLTQLEKK